MAYQDDGGNAGFQGGQRGGFQGGDRPRRQLVDVTALNITCAECGAPIESLPFQPTQREDGTYGKLFCYNCNKQRVRNRGPRPYSGGGSNY